MSGTELFGEGKDVMRVRRVRWIAIGAAIFTILATLAIGADAFASQDSARCTRPPAGVHQVAAHNSSWRAGAFRAFGCGAWRHMHHGRHAVWRTGLRS